VFSLFAAAMGGAGFLFSGALLLSLLRLSACVLLDFLVALRVWLGVDGAPPAGVFYSCSACMFPALIRFAPSFPACCVGSASPAFPDSAYGWE
jgi:hypothetical protein